MSEQGAIRVLIADDDALVSNVIQNQLEKLGYAVAGRAPDGQAAVDMAVALRPDVILMDIAMPEQDGLEATRLVQLRCPTPVVLLTAHDDPQLVARASAVGAGAYLVKPPHGREMDRAITIAMARFADLMELRRLNAELAAYDHSVSHDLKGPISLVCETAQFLLDRFQMLPTAEVADWLEVIVYSGYQASSIVESLLLLARPGDIPTRVLDMYAIVTAAARGSADLIKTSAATLDVVGDLPPALGHPDLVQRAWENYITNGIKYGGHPPRLRLGGEPRPGGMVRFWMQDNGKGIPPDRQSQLFAPFMRLETGEIKGHGIGLYLVKRIVERLGGQAGVESEGVPGQGSTFYFTLPAA